MQDRDWQAELRLRERQKESARQILGVSDSDGLDEIKRAWRSLSLKHHPDRNDAGMESHQRFILVNSAYRCLTKGKDCEQLDAVGLRYEEPTDGKYQLDNSQGYFAWWREMFFD